jgi:hypothetical protein
MKKVTFFLCFVALWTMATTVQAQLIIGESYKFFSAAAPTSAVYGTGTPGDNIRFHWDLPMEGDYFKVNSVAGQGDDVFQFELSPTAYLKPSGGGISPCNTYAQASYDFTWWRLIPDEEINGVQYYLLQHVVRPDRYMYFQESDQILYTNQVGEDGPPYDPSIRKYYQVAFEKSSQPSISLSSMMLAFSSPFLSKTVTVTGTNITGDITFTVPAGLTVSGAKVSNNTIAAADANGANVVTITAADYSRELDGIITVNTAGAAAAQTIVCKGGLKTGEWYTVNLLTGGFGVPVNLGDSIGLEDGLSHVAAVTPDATQLSQTFSFLPVTIAGDEAFYIRNGEGKYLAAIDDENRNCMYIPALTGSEYEEWSLSGQLVTTAIDYFTAVTFRVGRTDNTGYFLGLSSDHIAPGITIASRYPKDWPRGTFRLIETQAVVINYVTPGGRELKLPRIVLSDLTIDNTYTAAVTDKSPITVNGYTYTYNAALSTDNVIIGTGNSVINLVFDAPEGIDNADVSGKIAISRQYYDLTGRPASSSAKGVLLQKSVYDDGSISYGKTFVK